MKSRAGWILGSVLGFALATQGAQAGEPTAELLKARLAKTQTCMKETAAALKTTVGQSGRILSWACGGGAESAKVLQCVKGLKADAPLMRALKDEMLAFMLQAGQSQDQAQEGVDLYFKGPVALAERCMGGLDAAQLIACAKKVKAARTDFSMTLGLIVCAGGNSQAATSCLSGLDAKGDSLGRMASIEGKAVICRSGNTAASAANCAAAFKPEEAAAFCHGGATLDQVRSCRSIFQNQNIGHNGYEGPLCGVGKF